MFQKRGESGASLSEGRVGENDGGNSGRELVCATFLRARLTPPRYPEMQYVQR